MNRLAAAASAALLSLSLVSACGGDSDDASSSASSPTPSSSESSSPSPTETTLTDTDFGAPAKGAKVKGDGYTYRMPATWKDITADARTTVKQIDSAAGEASFDDGFRDTVNVSFDRAPGGTLDELEASVPDQLAKVVKKLDLRPRVVIDGVEALHYRGMAHDGATKYFLVQFATIDEDGRITIITFSLSPGLKKADREKVVNPVLASWRWTG